MNGEHDADSELDFGIFDIDRGVIAEDRSG